LAIRRDDPDHALALSVALERCGQRILSEPLAGWVRKWYPAHVGGALEGARAQINTRQWKEAAEALRAIDAAKLDAGRAMHLYHLLAIAELHLGEAERARWSLEQGRAAGDGGCCDLSSLIALATPLGEAGEEEASAWSADQAAVRAVVRAVASADARLAEGDAAGARAALERRVVWEAREVQSLGRLAEAHLAEEPAAPYDRYRKALALAAFTAGHAEQGMFLRRELPLPRARWDRARLDALSERARAWLAESFGDKMVHLEARHAPYLSHLAPKL
jgi:hypothetical protein